MKVYAEVYGCAANVADYEIGLGLLRQANFCIVDKPEDADICIVFTCTVKKPTYFRMLKRIKELSRINKRIIVAGCLAMVPKEREDALKINSDISFLGPREIDRIVEACKSVLDSKQVSFVKERNVEKICMPRVRKNKYVAVVPILEGCSWRRCAYCIVRFTRGKIYSFDINNVVNEVEQAIKEGCKEVWITSQDNAAYGIDKGKQMLPELINKICSIEGKFKVRIGMMQPRNLINILDDMIEAYSSEKVYKFLHIPVQSGSDRILELMQRGYTIKEFMEIVDKFRKAYPELCLSTDIIVGFPGETESNFAETLKLVEKIEPDIVNISKFGERPGTEAEKMPNKVPGDVIAERSKKLTELSAKIALEKNKRYIGRVEEILVTQKGWKGGYIGRLSNYKPVVIDKDLRGKFVNVRIVEARETYLKGILV